eukprot:m.24237 g.24237  ORF g.24237 m.24237 type:complete len:354 (+) comp8657_c0_seq1:22-1083(+)
MADGPAWFAQQAGNPPAPSTEEFAGESQGLQYQQGGFSGSNPAPAGSFSGSQQDGGAQAQSSGPTNLIINYIPSFYNETNLMALFSPFGAIRNCKLVMDKVSGKSLEYAFVDFESPTAALQAQQRVNGLPLGTKRLKVSFARPRSKAITNANLYIRNLPPHADDATLFQWFSQHGPIIQARVLRNPDGSSRGVGFVHFDQHEHAIVAIQRLNNVLLPGCSRPLLVKFAQKGDEPLVPGPAMFGVRHHHHHHHHHHGAPYPGAPGHVGAHGGAGPVVGAAGGVAGAGASATAAASHLGGYVSPHHHTGYQPLHGGYAPYGHGYPGQPYGLPFLPLHHGSEFTPSYGSASASSRP